MLAVMSIPSYEMIPDAVALEQLTLNYPLEDKDPISMWHLIEDFMDQSLFMKAMIGLGWLSVLIMVASLVAPFLK